MGNVHIPSILKDFGAVLGAQGWRAYLVGGAVRDMIRGKQPEDWDVATDAKPEEVMHLFRRVIPTGIKHGTVTVIFKGHHIETTTFRTESEYSNARHPDSVSYVATIEEDLSRRDFTMNAMAADLRTGTIVDPFGGEKDIKENLIRCVGFPRERFDEDGLRPIRAVRFASQLAFTIHEDTFAAITPALGKVDQVAKERIREEMGKMLSSHRPSVGLTLMERSGLMALLFPELAACRGVEQKGFHRFDVLDHLLLSCDGAPKDSLELRLSALLHDIGKPGTRKMDTSGVWTFHHHEALSSSMAQDIMRRYRYPTATIKKVSHLIEQHMFHYQDEWSDAAVRRFIARVGKEHLEDLFALRTADSYGTTGAMPPPQALSSLRKRIDHVLEAGQALSIKDLAIGGEDLASIGIPKGPRMGAILTELLETVMSDPEMNEREQLLRVAEAIQRRLEPDRV